MSRVDPVPDTQAYACPRCAIAVVETWYGPCTDCRRSLRETLRGEAHAVGPTDYVPKVNVTPNAVATKD